MESLYWQITDYKLENIHKKNILLQIYNFQLSWLKLLPLTKEQGQLTVSSP